jgi:competence protein ComGC
LIFKKQAGMTLIEALVVMVIIAGFILFVVLPRFAQARQHGGITCVNNLKQIGTAYQIWENDNGNLYPMQQKEALGGMVEVLSNSYNAGADAYLPYAIMQNELGQSPKVVLCPKDERTANTNFNPATIPQGLTNVYAPWSPGSFGNTNVSYFVGVGALNSFPQAILGGDRNLCGGGFMNTQTGRISLPQQDPNYGVSGSVVSPAPPTGADVIVNTNGLWELASYASGKGPFYRGQVVAWSAKMHSAGNPLGAGNILLGDGSAQQCTSKQFRDQWLRNAVNMGNFAASDAIHTGSNGYVRLLVP